MVKILKMSYLAKCFYFLSSDLLKIQQKLTKYKKS